MIPWSDDPAVFVANALSPAQVISVDIDEEHRIASVTVPERMLSLAIGREGQNARLAARLTGWRIDIRSDVSVAEAKAASDEHEAAEVVADDAAVESPVPETIDAVAIAPTETTETPADDTTTEATPVKPKRASRKKAVVEDAPTPVEAAVVEAAAPASEATPSHRRSGQPRRRRSRPPRRRSRRPSAPRRSRRIRPRGWRRSRGTAHRDHAPDPESVVRRLSHGAPEA